MISYNEPWGIISEADGEICLFDADDGMIAMASNIDHKKQLNRAMECVNAIYAAGIQPADVAVFVEAVRAWKDTLTSNPAKTIELLDHAAALLPERKESK